jgi:hypothetical protein
MGGRASLVVVGMATVACGGVAERHVYADTGGTGGTAQAGAAGASGSGGNGAFGSGGSGALGSGGSVSVAPGSQVTIETDVFEVGPGEEVFMCQNFKNPFGASVDLEKIVSVMNPGSHHLAVFMTSGGDMPLHSCSGLEFSSPIHTAQRPEHSTNFPEGVGRHLDFLSDLRINMHYFNPTIDTITGRARVTFVVGRSGLVPAGSVFFNNMGVTVPPHEIGTAQQTCAVSQDIKLLETISHMHQHATHFIAKTNDGTVVYETTEWDEPQPLGFSPPLELKAGTQITVTCTYDNRSDQTLTFGESAEFNEMCILGGTYFPAPDGQMLFCL